MSPDMAYKIRLANDLLEAGLLNEAEYLKAVTEEPLTHDACVFVWDSQLGQWDKVVVEDLKCECGAEKCKLPHSHWCPKYLEEV